MYVFHSAIGIRCAADCCVLNPLRPSFPVSHSSLFLPFSASFLFPFLLLKRALPNVHVGRVPFPDSRPEPPSLGPVEGCLPGPFPRLPSKTLPGLLVLCRVMMSIPDPENLTVFLVLLSSEGVFRTLQLRTSHPQWVLELLFYEYLRTSHPATKDFAPCFLLRLLVLYWFSFCGRSRKSRVERTF